jgi:hypothetical protein
MSERKIRALSIGCEISDYMNIGWVMNEVESDKLMNFQCPKWMKKDGQRRRRRKLKKSAPVAFSSQTL